MKSIKNKIQYLDWTAFYEGGAYRGIGWALHAEELSKQLSNMMDLLLRAKFYKKAGEEMFEDHKLIIEDLI